MRGMQDGRFLPVSMRRQAWESSLTVNLDQEWLDDIVSNHLKVGVTDPVRDLTSVFGSTSQIQTYGGPGTSEEVVKNSDLMTEQHQSINQVRSNETSSTSD
jgi:hypothetical protein